MYKRIGAILFIALLFISNIGSSKAQEFSSSNFNDSNPVIMVQGGRSTSTNFELISGSGQTVIGESTSSIFTYRSGFFYFPLVTTPVLTAAAGNQLVGLSWTAAVGSLGFTVTGYEVGQGAASDGPFSYTNVGNILTNTVSSLQNGTTYYFVVRALDYFGNSIVTSSVVAATPHVPPSGDSESDYTIKVTNGGVHFIGKTGPGSTVHVVQDGQQSATRVVDGAGNFDIRINDLTPGNYLYALYAIDSSGEKSSAVTFLVTIRPGEITLISGIFIPPTIGLDKSEVKPGDPITFKGETVTPGDVSIHIETPEGKDVFIKTTTDKDGKYTFTLDTDGMPEGSYTIRVRAIDKLGATSPWSITIPFAIGKKTVPAKKPGLCSGIADFNQDCRVDLVDFSILIYWFDRANPPEGVDLNRDRFVNLIDFSIMMYHWTG